MSSSNETGLGLFDDAASAVGNFPSALRGYDRSAVDDYVRALESAVVQSRRRAASLETQVTSLQNQISDDVSNPSTEDVDYTNLGGRASDILRLAEEQAREVLEQATVDAERMKETARREADLTRHEAARIGGDIKSGGIVEVQQLRQRGQDDARGQIEKAKAEAAAIVAAARRQAESLQRASDHEAQTLRQNAYLDTEGLRRAVEREVADIRQQVAAEREAAIAELRRVHEETVTRTSLLLEEATRHNQESADRLEHDIAEAARIRSEALAEAEQVKIVAIKEAEDRIAAARKQAAAITDRTQQEFAWRKQQLRRETDLLGQRKQAVLNQLASLSALAEQTAHSFPDIEDLDDFGDEDGDRTVLMPALPPTLPKDSAGDKSTSAGDEAAAAGQIPTSDQPSEEHPPSPEEVGAEEVDPDESETGASQDRAGDAEFADEQPKTEPLSKEELAAELSRQAEDSGTGASSTGGAPDEMDIDGDATIMVPKSQLPAGTGHFSHGSEDPER